MTFQEYLRTPLEKIGNHYVEVTDQDCNQKYSANFKHNGFDIVQGIELIIPDQDGTDQSYVYMLTEQDNILRYFTGNDDEFRTSCFIFKGTRSYQQNQN